MIPSRQNRRAPLRHALATASLLALLSPLPLHAAGPAAGGAAPPSPVTAIDVTASDLALTSRLPGRVKALEVAEVRPQVSGIIRERLFTEGALVKAGDPIYQLEDEEYRAAVEAAKAGLAQAEATAALAEIEEKRATELFQSNAGSAAKRDSAAATLQAARAGVMAAKASLRSAEISLERTTIRAPISGVVGLSQTTIGQLVAAGQPAALTTIRNLDSVYVDVTQSATDLLRRQGAAKSDGTPAMGGEAALLLPDGREHSAKGRLEAAEPQVEPTTGMITLRLTYPNPEHLLLPGMYVEVDLPRDIAQGAFSVPQNAVMRQRDGSALVWIIENEAVAVRPVEIASAAGNHWIITSGLKDGDQVITSGFQKAGPGAPVVRVPGPGDAPPAQADAEKAE